MKVKELKEKLKDIPDDFEVILSKDGEGNDYSPLAEIDLIHYAPENNWYGYVIDKMDWDEELDGGEFKENAVGMWPVN